MTTYAAGPTGVDAAYTIGGGHRSTLAVDPVKVFAHTTAIVHTANLSNLVAHRANMGGVVTYVAWPVTPTTGQLWPRGGWPGH